VFEVAWVDWLVDCAVLVFCEPETDVFEVEVKATGNCADTVVLVVVVVVVTDP
jgi:hypothetical protein